ncbi:MAG: mechanosensitive ion channel [Spirochaetales bacterium]|nr:mechanosensitive ion channel [Spirochaetales bacterium]
MENLLYTYGEQLLKLGQALVLLAAGWLAAAILAAGFKKLIGKAEFVQKGLSKVGLPVEREHLSRVVSGFVFFVVLLLAVVATMDVLDLKLMTEPINLLLNHLFAFLPKMVGAIGVMFMAWLGAALMRFAVDKGLKLAKFDEKISPDDVDKEQVANVSDTVANAAFWLVWLFFLPGILEALGLTELLLPLQGMLNKIMGFFPNILSAAVILVVGWFGAQILRRVVHNFLKAVGVDSLGKKAGITKTDSGKELSEVLAVVVYILALLPIIISSLDALSIEAISRPATKMLTTFVDALPSIFGAVLVLGVSFVVARVAAELIASLLVNIGFNRLPEFLGFKWNDEEGKRSPAELVGGVAMLAVILLAAIEAANLVGFAAVGELTRLFSLFAGDILLGLAIFGVGLYLARLAGRVLDDMVPDGKSVMATIARIAVIILAGFMGLMQMGVAEDIVILAFGLLLGALAVATALAFGLGCKDLAAQEVRGWLDKWHGKE